MKVNDTENAAYGRFANRENYVHLFIHFQDIFQAFATKLLTLGLATSAGTKFIGNPVY